MLQSLLNAFRKFIPHESVQAPLVSGTVFLNPTVKTISRPTVLVRGVAVRCDGCPDGATLRLIVVKPGEDLDAAVQRKQAADKAVADHPKVVKKFDGRKKDLQDKLADESITVAEQKELQAMVQPPAEPPVHRIELLNKPIELKSGSTEVVLALPIPVDPGSAVIAVVDGEKPAVAETKDDKGKVTRTAKPAEVVSGHLALDLIPAN